MLTLYGFTSTTGQLIGAAMALIGCSGIVGAGTTSRSMLNFYLVGVLLCIMLSFHFIGQVTREVTVDCALADLDQRIAVIERSEMQRDRDDMFTAVFARMDEMEESLEIFSAALQEDNLLLLGEKPSIASSDHAFIKSKLQLIEKHATQAVSALEKAMESRTNVNKLSHEDLDIFQNKIEAAQEVLKRIEKAHETGTEELTSREYAELLTALTRAYVGIDKHDMLGQAVKDGATELKREMSELPRTMQRWSTAKADSESMGSYYYHDYPSYHLYGGYESEALRDAQPFNKQRAERVAWREKFKAAVAEHRLEGTGMRDMPEHCLLEKAARKFISVLGTAVVALQLLCAWLVLSLLFRIPMKSD